MVILQKNLSLHVQWIAQLLRLILLRRRAGMVFAMGVKYVDIVVMKVLQVVCPVQVTVVLELRPTDNLDRFLFAKVLCFKFVPRGVLQYAPTRQKGASTFKNKKGVASREDSINPVLNSGSAARIYIRYI